MQPVPPGGGIPAATSAAAGLMTAAQAAAIPVFPFPEIDLTTLGATVIMPGVANKFFCCPRFGVLISQAAGTLSTAATIELGYTGALAGVFAASNTFTNSTAFNGAVPGWFTAGGPLACLTGPGLDLICTVTVAATGTGLTFKSKIILPGYYA